MAGIRYGWITTIRREGSPRTSRVWFVEVDGATWVATSLSTYKVADLRRDPRASFSIEGVDGGRTLDAELVNIVSRPDVLAAFRRDYHGWDANDASQYGPRVLIRLTERS